MSLRLGRRAAAGAPPWSQGRMEGRSALRVTRIEFFKFLYAAAAASTVVVALRSVVKGARS